MGGGIFSNIHKRLFIICMVLLCVVPIFAENETQVNEADFIIGSTETEETVPVVEKTSGTSTIWLFIRMILALILVVAIIYAIVYFLKKGFVPKQQENPFLKTAASLTLAPGKTVQVITMIDKAWLVSVSEAGIQLIGEITDPDIVNQLLLEAEKNPSTVKPRDFASILSSFTPNTKATEKALQKQRERLRNGGFNE